MSAMVTPSRRVEFRQAAACRLQRPTSGRDPLSTRVHWHIRWPIAVTSLSPLRGVLLS
jgi:hypothetical protein